MRPLIPSQPIRSSCNKTASRSASPSCRPFPLLAGPHQKKKAPDKSREPCGGTHPDHAAVQVRTGVQTNSAYRKTTALEGRKVVLYSLPFERLSFCSSAPSPHISEVPPIGRPLVVAFYVARGGRSWWEEDGLEKYKVRWAEGEEESHWFII